MFEGGGYCVVEGGGCDTCELFLIFDEDFAEDAGGVG